MRLACFAVLIVCGVSPQPARAAFVITVTSGTTTAGGTTTVSVSAHSDLAGGELLDSFGLELRITRLSGSGSLQFIDPQSAGELANSQYVFFGNSANATFPPPTSLILTTATPNDTYIGGDVTLSSSGVMVGAADRLLAVLDLSAASAVAGDRYRITVFGPGGGLGTTYFATPPTPSLIYYDWSAGDGVLDIEGGGAATPAPPSAVASLVCVLCLGGFAQLRRRGCVPP